MAIEHSSDAEVYGSWDESQILKEFSIRKIEESYDKQRKAVNTWKTNIRDWKKSKGKKKAFPIPGRNVPASQQIEVMASGKYLEKPYDQERLAELTEMNQRLKSSIKTYATNIVRTGYETVPTRRRRKADLSEKEIELFEKQTTELIDWLENKANVPEVSFMDLCAMLVASKWGLGDGYWELRKTAKGDLGLIDYAPTQYIWIGVDEDSKPDKYLHIRNGKTVYFRMFHDEKDRHVDTWEPKEGEEIPPKKRATKLLHYKEFNLYDNNYGIAPWTPCIPAVLGSRYAAEYNVNFFNNDATPRMVILVMGGALDDATVSRVKKFVRKGKGKENAGRVLVLAVSAKNKNDPNAKNPIVKLEPLTVGKQDDASFTKYGASNREEIREASGQAEIFFGTAGDINRAAAFTLRELVANGVYKPEQDSLARFINSSLLPIFAKEKGYVLKNDGPKATKTELMVQLHFKEIKTLGQKDEALINQGWARAGAMSPNDCRDILGLEKIDAEWADIPISLAVVMLQMQIIGAPNTGDFVSSVTDDTTKALVGIRQTLHEYFIKTGKKPTAPTLKEIEEMFFAEFEEDVDEV